MEADDGPILGAFRAVHPDYVRLFFTRGADPKNDYSQKAEETRQRLLAECEPGCDVGDPIELKGVEDPTNLDAVVASLSRAVADVRSTLPHDAQYFTNVASGTADMRIAWHYLRLFGLLSGQLIHVKESRFVKQSGDTRVRTVTLPDEKRWRGGR